MYCTGIFLEGMRRNNAKDIIQIAGFRVEFEAGMSDYRK
jgi:hypothetical protein